MSIYTFTNVFQVELPNDELAHRVSDELVTKGLFGVRVVSVDDIKVQRALVVEGVAERVVQDITDEQLKKALG